MGPLKGVRVLEIAAIGPAPMCAMLLADMGAEVVRIDRPSGSDLGIPVAPEFDLLARGRRSVGLDLKSPEGVEVFLHLVEGADVVIEGFRPGVAERLGVGPDACWERNPRVVFGRMTGWGQSGPLAPAAGHDLNYIALSGALHAIGRAGEPPAVPLNLVGDFGGGALYLAMGVLAALLEARSSGKGQVVDAGMVDGAASLMTMFYGLRAASKWSDERGVNIIDSGAPFYDVYETKDGKHVAVAALEPKFYAELVRRIGLTPSSEQTDRRRWPELRAALAETFRTKTREEWCQLLEGTDACFAPVLGLDEAPNHPHNRERGTFIEIAGVVQPAPAPRFSRTPAEVQSPPPRIGQHTDAVLEAAGFSPGRIAELRERGIIA